MARIECGDIFNPNELSTELCGVTEENNEQRSLADLTSQLISVTEAAARTGLSTAWIRRLLQRGEIQGVKVGRNWLTTEHAVRDYLETDRRPGPKTD